MFHIHRNRFYLPSLTCPFLPQSTPGRAVPFSQQCPAVLPVTPRRCPHGSRSRPVRPPPRLSRLRAVLRAGPAGPPVAALRGSGHEGAPQHRRGGEGLAGGSALQTGAKDSSRLEFKLKKTHLCIFLLYFKAFMLKSPTHSE